MTKDEFIKWRAEQKVRSLPKTRFSAWWRHKINKLYSWILYG